MTAPDLAVAVARLFHEAYERLAPDYGYRTREASAKPWGEVPEQNRALMIATCAEIVPAMWGLFGEQVQEALRDKQRFDTWFALPTDQRTLAPDDQTWPECLADYLRDTLAGDGGEA